MLAERIERAELFIECDVSNKQKEEITEELEQLKSYDSDGTGKLKVLPKAKIKENIGRSPDYRDCLMMREWFELNPYKGKYKIL
jgi:hypothetical protein